MSYFMKNIYLLVLLASSLYPRDYIWPTDASKTLTDVFGGIRGNGRHHTGIDIRTHGINGFDVYAIENGYISKILVSTSGYGKALYLTMEDGNTSLYAHLDRFNNKLEIIKNQLQEKCDCYTIEKEFSEWELPVSKGDVIAYTGDTGGVSGAHLHFEIRNKKKKPFNPLLTNYSVNDTIPPIPKNLIITNLNKNSSINGIPKEAEFSLKKITDNEYIYDEIIAVNGEFGVSLEVIDRMNKSKFKYDIYSIKLLIDNETIYESKYNNISFDEGYKVFSERDYSKHVYDKRSVYNLYNKYNLPPSSFIKKRSDSALQFNDKFIHECQIIVSDFNKNQTTINFKMLHVDPEPSEFNIQIDDGLLISSNNYQIQDIELHLATRLNDGLKTYNFNKEKITNQIVKISNYNTAFDVLACQPIYKNGTRGATEYISLKESNISLGGDIKILDKEHGVIIQYIEREFSNKEPVLGLTLDSLVYKYPLSRVGKNEFLSEFFYPRELRELSNISVFYLDSLEQQFSLDLESEVSISRIPINMTYGDISIVSKEELDNSKQLKENMIHNDTFFYIMPTNDFENPDNNKIIHSPFILGPMEHPLKNKLEITYNASSYIDQLGIYKYDKRRKKWNFIDNNRELNKISATVKSGGIYSIIRDSRPPRIRKTIPAVNSTYRHDHFDKIQFDIEDKLSGIKNENNINVYLNGEKLIVEYNTYRKVVHYNLKNKLEVGSHTIKIEVSDNVGNISVIDGEFFIQ